MPQLWKLKKRPLYAYFTEEQDAKNFRSGSPEFSGGRIRQVVMPDGLVETGRVYHVMQAWPGPRLRDGERYLVRYCVAGRGGRIESLFVCSIADYQRLIGAEVYFGEVLGKHSSVGGTIAEAELTIVSKNQDLIGMLVAANGYNETLCGYNPLNYIVEEEES